MNRTTNLKLQNTKQHWAFLLSVFVLTFALSISAFVFMDVSKIMRIPYFALLAITVVVLLPPYLRFLGEVFCFEIKGSGSTSENNNYERV